MFTGRILNFYGKISYSIYLFHPIFLKTKQFWDFSGLPLEGIYYFPLLTAAFSTKTFYGIERLFINLAAYAAKKLQDKFGSAPGEKIFTNNMNWIITNLFSLQKNDLKECCGPRPALRESTDTICAPDIDKPETTEIVMTKVPPPS